MTSLRDDRLIDAAALLLTFCAIGAWAQHSTLLTPPPAVPAPQVETVSLSLAEPPPPAPTPVAQPTAQASPDAQKMPPAPPVQTAPARPESTLPATRPARLARHKAPPKQPVSATDAASTRDAPMAPAHTTPAPATSGASVASLEARYVAELHAVIALHTSNPTSPLYRMLHPHGTATVAFTVARDGSPSDARVLGSSGAEILDTQAKLIVVSCHFPPIPAELYTGAPSHEFRYDITFRPPVGAD